MFPSILISDAFEATTNGMSNPEVFIELKKHKEDSEVKDWYLIIKAIKSFYEQDFVAMRSFLSEITENSLASRLKNVLSYMSGENNEKSKLSKNEEFLVKKVTAKSNFLKSALSDIEESLVYGKDIFIDTITIVIKELSNESIEAAKRLTLWAFEECYQNNFDEDSLAENVLDFFGQAEGFRLIGLSLIENNPTSALLCFIRSLIKKITAQTVNNDGIRAYMDILEALHNGCSENDPAYFYIPEFLNLLASEMSLYYQSNQETNEDLISRIKYLIKVFKPTEETLAKANKNSFEKQSKKEAVQLELF